MRTTILRKDQDKQALIQRLSDQNMSLMFFYEEDPGESVMHEKVDESIYLVHPPYDYNTLGKWLYLGNWQAVFPANREYKPFNTFKTENAGIEKQVSESRVKLIIDSFHDDTEWKVIEEI